MYPLKALSFRSKKKVILANIFIWIISIILSLPQGYYRHLETFDAQPDPVKICTTSPLLQQKNITIFHLEINMEQFFVLYTILVSYVLPLLTIVFCYLIMIKKIYSEKRNVSFFKLTKKRQILC